MKKILAVILSIIMVFSLCACGDKEKAEKYCFNCGEGISKDVMYCEHCGTKVGDAKNESEVNSTNTESTASKPATTTSKPITTSKPTSSTPTYTDVRIISGEAIIAASTINTDVYITSTGVATFHNVTVNGNIYCYGQLKCSSCTANNLYAYAYGSMISCGAFDGTHGNVTGEISYKNLTVNNDALNYAFSKWGKK